MFDCFDFHMLTTTRMCLYTPPFLAQWVIKGHVMYVFLSFQLLQPLKTQEDLEQAVLTLGCSSGANGLLRILLKTPKNNHVSP